MDLTEEDAEDPYQTEEGDEVYERMSISDRSAGFASRAAFEQFKGRNRQYGNAVCPECKQSFVNSARLERHLAVHQVFGAYLCPLCGKTYKYEYNLFFHWRKTCQYLNELVNVDQRKSMDVQSLRLLVEEVLVKKNETEPVDIGISSKALFQGSSSVHLEMPIDPQSPLARACMICGILVHKNHLPQHEALHSSTIETGLRLLDMQSPTGGHYCDLCGVAFRRKDNLYTHWRSSCPEIMANIEPGSELFLSDMELKEMVLNLLLRLRRMSRQSPLRPLHPIFILTSLNHRNLFLFEETRNPYANTSREMDDGKGPSTSSGDEDKLREAVVYMDDYVNPADTVVDINGELVNVVSADRGKWNISEDSKPLECPDCFRFKYDYNLLFHYRHSCAYTKLLVGADVRKLLDAASLRKLVSHIKQTDPELRPGSSRLVNIKRRPSIKAVPRNILPLSKNSEKMKLKRGSEDWKKCPVCAPVLKSGDSVGKPNQPPPSLNEPQKMNQKKNKAAQLESYGMRNSAAEDAETPPVLEMEGPGEAAPSTTRCVDIHGEEITDFDADQLAEMDMMLYSGQLALGDLEEVEYRVAVGTRHGSRIVLEKMNKSPHTTVQDKESSAVKESHEDQQINEHSSRRVKEEKNVVDEQSYNYQGDVDRGEEGAEYTEDDDLGEYVNEENAEIIDYHSSQLVEYEIDGAEAGQEGRRLVRIVDGRGQQLLHYLNEEDVPCDAFVQYVEDDNGQQIVEYIEGEDGEHIVQYISADNMTGDEVMVYMKPQASSSSEVKDERNSFNANTSEARKSADQYPPLHAVTSSASNNMPEDFMQETALTQLLVAEMLRCSEALRDA
ncbi:zinc finger, C2H2 type [Ancylostoma duodenale]|uniref:Zinc finger, C2H2 type n=1 Tax=Ancylostoma duodenale TaxID=51022 RepID=A0A0C2H6Z7_9BILA|nr:zinc finger, C2H2 type [Ancylostoma duodenale]